MHPLYRLSSLRTMLPAVVILIILVLIFPGCRSKRHSPEKNKQESAVLAEDKGFSSQAGILEPAGVSSRKPAAPVARKLILAHSVTIEVAELQNALQTLARLAEVSGGYTNASARSRNEDGSSAGSIEMRIPPAKAGNVMEKLRSLGLVMNESSSGEDITEEYVDLEARLKNMKASENRLQGLLLRQTQKLADVLAVERELTRVRGEIEAYEARKRSWDTLTALVTFHIELREPAGAAPTFYRLWNPVRTAFAEAAVIFAESLRSMIVFAGSILPWAAAGLGLVILALKRRKSAKMQPGQLQ